MNTYNEILSLSVLPSYLAQSANDPKSQGIISFISFLFLFIYFITALCFFNTITPDSRVNIIFHPIKLQMVYSICICVGGRLSTCQAYMVDSNLGANSPISVKPRWSCVQNSLYPQIKAIHHEIWLKKNPATLLVTYAEY